MWDTSVKFNIQCRHKSFLYRYINLHKDIFYSVNPSWYIYLQQPSSIQSQIAQNRRHGQFFNELQRYRNNYLFTNLQNYLQIYRKN